MDFDGEVVRQAKGGWNKPLEKTISFYTSRSMLLSDSYRIEV